MTVKTSLPVVQYSAANYTSMLNEDLQPYQTASVAHIASAQRQMVNGFNYYLAVVVKEEMSFDTERQKHGWPDTTLHWVTMHLPGAWNADHDWQIGSSEVVTKEIIVDPKMEHKASMVHHYDALCTTKLNLELAEMMVWDSSLKFSEYEQQLVSFMRAEVQQLSVPHIVEDEHNVTVLDPYVVNLVHVTFLTKCMACDNPEQEHIGVGVVVKDANGAETVLSVFSEIKMVIAKSQDEDKREASCKKSGGMGGGGVFAIVFVVSGCVAAISYYFGSKSGKNAAGKGGGSWGPQGDWDADVSTSTGMDMRPMEGVVAKAEDVDMDL